jgi:hypothetical protein
MRRESPAVEVVCRESEAEPRKKEGYCKVARAGRRLSFVDDG